MAGPIPSVMECFLNYLSKHMLVKNYLEFIQQRQQLSRDIVCSFKIILLGISVICRDERHVS